MKKAVLRVFSFYWELGRRRRRTKVFFLLSLLPVVLALIFKLDQVAKGISSTGVLIFSNIILMFELQFLIVILALFFGTSICSEDVEAKTLAYITTRPVSKKAVVLGKYLAYSLIIILMSGTGMLVSFLILNTERLLQPALYLEFLRAEAVLGLGLLTYGAFFTFLGALFKKSIIFGLMFGFGWESIIQYFPGSTQRFAIVHYLKSLLPQTEVKASFLTFRLEPTPPLLAILTLGLIAAVFLTLSCLIFSWKQYVSED